RLSSRRVFSAPKTCPLESRHGRPKGRSTHASYHLIAERGSADNYDVTMTLDKILGALKAALAVAARVLLVVLFVQTASHSYPPGRLAPAEPIQSTTVSRTWEKNGYSLTSLARYRIDALVMSTERYWFDGGADLSPVDFAVAWGPMSDPAILGKLRVS